MKASLFAVCSSQDESESAKVGAVRQSILAILARVVWFVCVCVWLMCGSALFEPCGAAFFVVLLRCNHWTLCALHVHTDE